MEEEGVGEGGEAFQSFGVVHGDGFFAEIAAGHHQGTAYVAQQNVVQRRGRQHHTERVVVGRDVVHDERRPPLK